MNAARTRRKGKKEEVLKNVNEVLASAKDLEQELAHSQEDAVQEDNSTRTASDKRPRKSKSKLSRNVEQEAATKEANATESESEHGSTQDKGDSAKKQDGQDSPSPSNEEAPETDTAGKEQIDNAEAKDSKVADGAKQTDEVHNKVDSAEGKETKPADVAKDTNEAKQATNAETLARIEKTRAQAKAVAKANAKAKTQEHNQDQDDDNAQEKRPNANLQAMLAGITLAFFAALCVLCIITVDRRTEGRIQAYRAQQEQELLSTMLPQAQAQAQGQLKFQCKLLSDARIGKNMQAYLVQDAQGHNLGLIANYATSRGYSNPLILMAGVDMQGNVTRIEVKLSKETPGIGDKVEHRRGNYLDQFVGFGLDSANWEVKKFGGQFDYITGATVTSRAVVLATRDLLQVLRDTTHPDLLPNCR